MARIRAIAIVSTLAIIGIVLAVVTLTRDTQSEPPAVQRCPSGYVPANLKLPEAESDVNINVFNATNTPNLATNVASDFTNRKFKVKKVGDEKKKLADTVAVLRYGPKAVGAAQLLRAYFLNDTDNQFDIHREDDIVDVVIGGGYRQLATPTEMRQAVAQLGNPEAPDGTCAETK